MNPKISTNVAFIKTLYENGYDQVGLDAIPYPESLNYCKSKCPILAVTSSLVLIYTNSTPNANPKSISKILTDATVGAI